jgi:hypothetical protein
MPCSPYDTRWQLQNHGMACVHQSAAIQCEQLNTIPWSRSATPRNCQILYEHLYYEHLMLDVTTESADLICTLPQVTSHGKQEYNS